MASAPRSTRSLSVGDALKGAPGAPAPQSSVTSCEEGGGGEGGGGGGGEGGGRFIQGGERRALSLIFRCQAQGWSEHQRPLYQRVINVLNLERKECVCQRLTVEGLRGRVHTHKGNVSNRRARSIRQAAALSGLTARLPPPPPPCFPARPPRPPPLSSSPSSS